MLLELNNKKASILKLFYYLEIALAIRDLSLSALFFLITFFLAALSSTWKALARSSFALSLSLLLISWRTSLTVFL